MSLVRRCLPAVAAATVLLATPLLAQDANVETMALILSAEDARAFDEGVLRSAMAHPDSSLRSLAALSAGRLRDSRAIPLLLPLLRDRDTLTQAMAIFALGMIGDTAAVQPMITRAQESFVSTPAALELVTAMSKIGGASAASFMRSVFAGTVLGGDRQDRSIIVARAAQDSYRLGRLASVNEILGLMSDNSEDVRTAAAFTLGRLRVPAGIPRLMEVMTSRGGASVKASAARALTRAYVDSAGGDANAVADQLARSTDDATPGVRINALRSLGTFKQARLAGRIVPLTDDPFSNVQVQAVITLGELGGPVAVTELNRIATSGKGNFARRREALLGLAANDSALFVAAAARWAAANDWRERAAAAVGSARFGRLLVAPFLRDRDPRVQAAALQAWNDRATDPDSALIEEGRRHLQAADAGVRSVAAEVVGRAAVPGDIQVLVASYQRSTRDSFPDAALAVLNALHAIAESSPEARATVDRVALAGLPRPTSYLIQEWAQQNWPAASQSWGGPYPIRTGRTLEDYREIARRFLVSTSPGRYPTVKIEIDQLGTVELELFGPDAPLTVANFLMLVNRRYFDGMRFHRVVPNFVVQTGDPRGDGFGGPGTVIRDEINRRRYQTFFVGMALSGPDTGGSQWFITLSPQPHLDGTYTIFGRVSGGEPALLRVTQGDLIRTISP